MTMKRLPVVELLSQAQVQRTHAVHWCALGLQYEKPGVSAQIKKVVLYLEQSLVTGCSEVFPAASLIKCAARLQKNFGQHFKSTGMKIPPPSVTFLLISYPHWSCMNAVSRKASDRLPGSVRWTHHHVPLPVRQCMTHH